MQPRTREITTVKPDAKGRITLGSLAKGVSSFKISRDKHNRIILEPYVEIPERERWLFNNKEALDSVLEGLKDSAAGRVKSLGSFARYKDDEVD